MEENPEEIAKLKHSLVQICDSAIAYMLQVKQGYHLFRPETYDDFQAAEEELVRRIDDVCNQLS